MARRTRSKGRSSGGLGLFLLGILVGAAALCAFLFFGGSEFTSARGEREAPSASPRGDGAEPQDGGLPVKSAGSARAEPKRPPAARPAAAHAGGDAVKESEGSEPAGRVALVIDDLGRSLEDIDTLKRLGVPISYAVLPFEDHTPEVAAELRRRGEEILCHLPMEPRNGEDPGPGALRLGMPRDQLRELTAAALAAVPGAVGVNNHMGSGLTADEGSMEAILSALSARGLFFLDSRTSAESVGYREAIELGLPAAQRQVFLDSDPKPEAIHAQFRRLLGLARERGAAIAIGHPYPATLAALAAEVPRAKEEGYEFVLVSYLLDRPGETGE